MYIEYYENEWPAGLIPDVRRMVADLESAKVDNSRTAYLCPPRDWERGVLLRSSVRCFVTNGGTSDWLVTIAPRIIDGSLPDTSLILHGMKAAAYIGRRWRKHHDPETLEALSHILNSRVRLVDQDAWLSGSGVLIAKGGYGMPSKGASRTQDLPSRDPRFAAHFTSEIYGDDALSAFAPFGSDLGYDMVYHWAERREELKNYTLEDVLRSEGVEVGSADEAESEIAEIIVSAAFTMLRLAGRIDEGGRTQALDALSKLIEEYESPVEFVTMRDDLASWRTDSV